jgi:multiple sugar transport system substrate-binding protein
MKRAIILNQSPLTGGSMLNKIAGHEVDRRLLLKGAAAGGLGIAGATMLAGCAPGSTGPISFGARTVDESPTIQLKGLVDAYIAKTGN